MKLTLSSDIELFAAAPITSPHCRRATYRKRYSSLHRRWHYRKVYAGISVKVNGAYYVRGVSEFYVEVTG
jgi:hypothetical protein